MVRWFFLFLFIPLSIHAQSLRYGIIEFNPVTKNQANAAPDFINVLLTGYDVKVLLYEYTPTDGNAELDQNTFRMSLGLISTGAQASTLLDAIEAEAQSRGITVTVKKPTSGLRVDLVDCLNTHGTSLANRPALKTCAIQALADNRVQIGEDAKALKVLLRSYGFSSIRDLKAWLNET